MLCQECQGSGWSMRCEIEGQALPCDACAGCGLDHCCTGDVVQLDYEPAREPWWKDNVVIGGEG